MFRKPEKKVKHNNDKFVNRALITSNDDLYVAKALNAQHVLCHDLNEDSDNESNTLRPR